MKKQMIEIKKLEFENDNLHYHISLLEDKGYKDNSDEIDVKYSQIELNNIEIEKLKSELSK